MHENLYSATYSGVAVYEFIHPKSSVMRRKKDGWVNATHILKVANFPKAKRTRILEKDVQTGVHEKVQGGYGKYQGTWVPLKRAIEIAQQFGVLNDLTPVFDYVSNGAITPPPAPKHHHATTASGTRKQRNAAATSAAAISPTVPASTTKSKAKGKAKMKTLSDDTTAQPKSKRQKLTTTQLTLPPPPALGQPKPQPLPSMSIHPQSNDRKRPSALNILTSTSSQNPMQSPIGYNNPSQSRNALLISDSERSKRILKAPKGLSSSFQATPMNSHFPNMDEDLDDDIDDDLDDENENNNDNNIHNNNDDQHSIGLHRNNNLDSMKNSESFYRRLHEPSTAEFMSEQDLDKALAASETYGLNNNNTSNNAVNSLQLNSASTNTNLKLSTLPTSAQSNKSQSSNFETLDKSYVKALYNYFIEMDSNPNCEMPYFITHQVTNFNINQPIDNQGNTLLHWACSMGDVKMCEILISRDCNTHVLNNKGEEPIVRSVIYANCYTKRTFNKLLDLLSDCLLDIDLNGRTLLHHIALATCDKNNLPSSRYYTEILLRKVAEIVHSNQIFKEFIDKKDIDGNTALHLMSFNNSKKCIKILLGYNARVDIRNKRNDQVGDYLTDNFKNESNNHPGLINLGDNLHHQNTNNEMYDSFSLRPFNPSFSNNHLMRNNSIPYNRMQNSFLEPFQLHSLHHQSIFPNLNQSAIIGNNNDGISHSKTSLKISKFSIEMQDKLNELSNAFDNEISQKNEDISELSTIVKQMDNDLEKTTNDVKNSIKMILGTAPATDETSDIADSIKKIEVQSNDLSEDYNDKKNDLRRLIDRTQAMDLAKIVQQYEHESLSKLDKDESSLEPKLSEETMHQLVDLALLQIIRKKTVSILVNIQASSESNNDTINSYRRLVSKLSSMPIDEVDSSLNSIEECLRKDNENEEAKSNA